MRPRNLLVGTLAILASTIAAWAAWTCYASWYEIPVVRTYGDLLRVRPLEVEGGVTVRVGLEARTCTVGSGVLVYVLVEGAHRPTNPKLNEDQAGPLLIRARPEMDSSAPIRWGTDPPAWPDPPAGTNWTLFTKTRAPVQEGPWRVEALTLAGEVVRQSRLEAKPGSVHPWIRWGEWIRSTGTPRAPAEGKLPVGPELFLGELKIGAKLPVLFPESPDPTLVISAIEGGVSVQSAEDIVTVAGEYPLLVRLWRNGAPWVPNVSKRRSGSLLGGAHARKSLELHVMPTLDCAALPGDRFELQILHCANGWDADPTSRWVWSVDQFARLDHDTFPRLSNRVALTTQ